MRKISASVFGLILVCFLLPFVTVSCQNTPVVRLNGFNLAIGTTINTPSPLDGSPKINRIPGEAFATGALLCATIGVATSFLKPKKSTVIPAVSGGLGFLFLLFLKSKLEDDILRQGTGMLMIDFQSGYWLAFLLFIGATALNGYRYSQSRKLSPVADQQDSTQTTIHR